jgi:cytochrome o ubiquinol oxidase operon protein cyoD
MSAARINSSAANIRYLIGFGLALLLTVLAFGIVWLAKGLPAALHAELPRMIPWTGKINGKISKDFAIACVFILAISQILVHMRYFLHLDFTANNHSKIIALLFTLLILVIMVGGSLLVMSDINRMVMYP